MRLPSRVPAVVVALLLLPALAHAGWPAGGTRIGAGDDVHREFVAAASGPDRVVVASIQYAGGDRYEVRAWAWMSDGTPVPGWPRAGVRVSAIAGQNQALAVTDDGAGGAYVAWANSVGSEVNTWLQHVTGGGGIASGWAPDGLRLGTSFLFTPPALAADGAGGVLVAWSYYDAAYKPHMLVQHLDAAGTPRVDWPAGGVQIPDEVAPGLLVDRGKIYLSTVPYDPVVHASTGMIVRRMNALGLPDPSWPQGGTRLTDAHYPSGTRLFPDGSGGVFAGWSWNVLCFDCWGPEPSQWTYRVRNDGLPDDRWAPGQRAFSTAPDQTGGVLLATIADGRPGAVRLDAAGAPMPGWSAVGNPATTERVEPSQVAVTGDGGGGAFVAWVDARNGTSRLYASRLDPSGVRFPDWPATSSVVGNGHATSYGIQMITLSRDAAIVVWEEYDSAHSTYAGYLTALRPGPAGPIAPARGSFAIVQTGPNPVIGAIDVTVEVRDQGPARLDLVDAAGRVRESRDDIYFDPIYCGICGPMPARSTVRFNQSRALPAGVYWLRLTQAGHVATSKVVVLR